MIRQEMEKILRDHWCRYPLSQPRDAVKLIYQSEFGGGHLLTDRKSAEERLLREWRETDPRGREAFEPIGGGLVRMNLSALNSLGIGAASATGLFALACRPRGSEASLEKSLALLEEMTAAGLAPFSSASLSAFLSAWRSEGMPPVSHSEAYRAAYHPAYRLTESRAVPLVPLLAAVDETLHRKGSCVLKIDGRCASGKSTLAQLLFDVYAGTEGGARLFHMDDYFLPGPRKTPERLAQPGGNVDWERFQAEVDRFSPEQEIRWQPYSCRDGELLPARREQPAALHIVEGAYALHPRLSTPDLAVFMDISPDLQKERILQRNGEKMLSRFVSEWIPLEEAYISARLKDYPFQFRFRNNTPEFPVPESTAVSPAPAG